MAEKQKSAQKSRDTKVSAGTARGSRPVRLTELQKILIVNGGLAHHLRRGQSRRPAEQTKQGRAILEAARESAEAQKKADREKKLRLEATAAISGSGGE